MFQQVAGIIEKKADKKVSKVELSVIIHPISHPASWYVTDIQLQEGSQRTLYVEHISEMKRSKEPRVVIRGGQGTTEFLEQCCDILVSKGYVPDDVSEESILRTLLEIAPSPVINVNILETTEAGQITNVIGAIDSIDMRCENEVYDDYSDQADVSSDLSNVGGTDEVDITIIDIGG